MGSFTHEKKRYRLVSKDVGRRLGLKVSKAIHYRRSSVKKPPVVLNISNTEHVIEPETHDEGETDFDPGMYTGAKLPAIFNFRESMDSETPSKLP